MTSHELAKALLEANDCPISATVEIDTGILDKHGDEIIVNLECYDLIDLISLKYHPNGKVTENILQFETSGDREGVISVLGSVRKAADRAVKSGVI